MRRTIATVVGVLFLLAAGFFYILSVSTNFTVGYLNPSASLRQAVERVCEAGEQPGSDAHQRLVRTTAQTTGYIQSTRSRLRRLGLCNTLAAAVAGFLILLFSRWIPVAQQSPDSKTPSA